MKEEENRRLKYEEEEVRCVSLWSDEAARQKAPQIILHKLRKDTHTLPKHIGGY